MECIHQLAMSASRCRKMLFRHIKYKITLEIFKSNQLQAYEKENCRLSGYERIIREDHQNCATKGGKLICKK